MVLVDIDKQYKFPTQLNEITLKQFISINTLIKKGEFDEALIDLLDIDSEIYFNIDYQGRLNLIELLTILMNGEVLFEETNIDLYDLESCPIGQFEDWKATIIQFANENQEFSIPFLCLLEKGDYDYYKRSNQRYLEFLEMPCSVALFYQNKVNQQFEELKTKFLPLFESDMEDMQIEAGAESLNQFGGYGTLIQLANGIYKDIEQVSKTSVAEAYTFLSYKKIERQYIENLEKLKREEFNRNI
jgi:hypothetical protein